MDIDLIRKGIGTNLRRIRSMRVTYDAIPDQPNPPQAIIGFPNSVRYDQSFGGAGKGTNMIDVPVMVFVGRVSERDAMRRLNSFIGTGAGSVKAAIEYDRQLGGSVFDCRVSEMNSVSSATINDITYLVCEFAVQVYAQ